MNLGIQERVQAWAAALCCWLGRIRPARIIEKFPTKRMVGQLLMSVVVLSVTMMFGQGQIVTPAAKTPSSADAAAAELKQIENDWVASSRILELGI